MAFLVTATIVRATWFLFRGKECRTASCYVVCTFCAWTACTLQFPSLGDLFIFFLYPTLLFLILLLHYLIIVFVIISVISMVIVFAFVIFVITIFTIICIITVTIILLSLISLFNIYVYICLYNSNIDFVIIMLNFY